MRLGPALFLLLSFPSLAFAVSPRITFERIVPAPYDLGDSEVVALVSAIGDTQEIEYLIEQLIDHGNREGTLRMHDSRSRRHPFILETLRKNEPADAYLAIRAFTCTSEEKSGQGSVYDRDGKRVPQREKWVEARCMAKLDVLTASGMRVSFAFKGEGASQHGQEIGEDDREDALLHAARFAAIDAAEKITPRRVRESIPLDETGPSFEEGYALIAAGRLDEARKIWETEMRRAPRVAPLHFNLAALCEALGDRAAAERHHAAARQLAPQEARYASEYKAFVRRAITRPR